MTSRQVHNFETIFLILKNQTIWSMKSILYIEEYKIPSKVFFLGGGGRGGLKREKFEAENF